MTYPFEALDLLQILPEIFILSMACIIMVVDLYVSQENRGITYMLSQLTLVVAGFLIFNMPTTQAVYAFNNTYVHDQMSDILKIVVLICTFAVFLYSKEYLRARNIFKGEFFVLALFAVLGMMILISAHNLLTIYLGLELMSLSLYAMVALHRDSMVATESAMKYFILGAIASGMLLYGMSLLYGISGSLDLAEINASLSNSDNKLIIAFTIVFLIVGVAFKLGAVPFHMWVPDVYDGAPTAVTIFIGTAPKVAAFAMLIRLMVDTLGPLHSQWQDILILLAIMSMAIGNIVAIAQVNIKRMLAYSTVSHVGFLLLGVISGTQQGYAASMFYTITYVVMGLGGFGMILFMSRAGFEADKLNDFKGLNERSPWFAGVMLIFMFSMAGVPPFLGFWGKWFVLKEIVAVDLTWLAVVAVLFSVIGAYYYLRMIKVMYFDKPETTDKIISSADMRLLLSSNALAVLAVGLYPTMLMMVCISAFSA
ncbi:NADH-ubiquinone oxidoreductase chain N [hydrothermal vent metagenome]|uniref:NADH-ubiquinone oxidoreductase chain N n=1 Tax=hydrothermal vent metagenome TaxID=652676 RepID=A0A3B1B2I4_9ZZZZ